MTVTRCPYCAEEIQPEAVKCKHCLSWLSGPPEGVVTSTTPQESIAPAARLCRSSTDRMLAGVCGGLGRYLAIDPTLVRILVALAIFFTAIVPGIVVYLILAFVVPLDGAPGL